MNARTYRLFPLLLVLLLGLTACQAGGKPREVHKVDWVTAPAYIPEDIDLPVQTGDLSGCCTDGEYMYILADEKTEDGVRSILSRASLTDGTVEVLSQYEPPQAPDEAFVERRGPVAAPDGTLWVYEMYTMMYFDLPEDYDPETTSRAPYYTGQDDFHHLRQLDPKTGKEKKLVDLSEAVRTLEIANISDASGFAVDGRGNIYIAGSGGVAVMNRLGKYLFTLDADLPFALDAATSGGTLALLPDGRVAALTIQPGGRQEVRTIDPDAQSWGAERYTLPRSVSLLYGGTGGFLFFYTAEGELYAQEPESEESRRLLSWSDVDLEGAVMCFAPLDGGKLAVLTFQYAGWYSSLLRAALLSPSDKDPNAGKVKLIYGTTFASSRERERVAQFNRQNDRYVIEIRDYGGIDDAEYFELPLDEQKAAVDAAEQLLRAEIASGRIPDIWAFGYQADVYSKQGYLEDLWPWIDGDEELGGREALMDHVLECASMDGKLYTVSSGFSIKTMAARRDVVGQRSNWTLEELLEEWRSLPEGSRILDPSMDGMRLLDHLVSCDESRWIDWSSGECYFDSQTFRELLELCRQVQQDSGQDTGTFDLYSALREGRVLMTPASLSLPRNLIAYDALCAEPEDLWDYEAYLAENGIFSSNVDENGNFREDGAILCDVLNAAAYSRETGKVLGFVPLAADAVFGALEGGGYAAYVGYPSQDGSGSYFSLNHDCRFGMSAACRHKEGAWAFIRQCLLPGSGLFKATRCFPINKADFDQCFQPKWFMQDGEYLLDAAGNRIEEAADLMPVPYILDEEHTAAIVVYQLAPNQAQKEQFMELYRSVRSASTLNPDLWNILYEQVQPYFAGDKSLDETVDLIQRRATLYVNENR